MNSHIIKLNPANQNSVEMSQSQQRLNISWQLQRYPNFLQHVIVAGVAHGQCVIEGAFPSHTVTNLAKPI
jgi:hypothetical protein